MSYGIKNINPQYIISADCIKIRGGAEKTKVYNSRR
jgi:hypothetical protein